VSGLGRTLAVMDSVGGGVPGGTGGQGWVDLALNPPGIGVTHEAARRRQVEGAGADRSARTASSRSPHYWPP
jgi:hypothetical protein